MKNRNSKDNNPKKAGFVPPKFSLEKRFKEGYVHSFTRACALYGQLADFIGDPVLAPHMDGRQYQTFNAAQSHIRDFVMGMEDYLKAHHPDLLPKQKEG